MKHLLLLGIFCFCSYGFSQSDGFTSKEVAVTSLIDGTLLYPDNVAKPNLAIIIAGSGPTDRNGNQNFLKNNALKKLAEGLSKQDIATFRYDKRIVKQIRRGKVDKTISFDDFVKDAKAVIDHFKARGQYNKIFVIGHSQGSLVGMLAAKEAGADGFVSLAGAGQNIGDVITEQVKSTAPMFAEDTQRIITLLKSGKKTSDYPQALASMFDISLQPFMISWMKYHPEEEIKTLNIPILLINGTKDLQVSIKEAERLKAANKNAILEILENMNHVLFEIKGDDLENSKSYNEPFRPIMPGLVSVITKFINN